MKLKDAQDLVMKKSKKDKRDRITIKDVTAVLEFANGKHWGMESLITLYGCDSQLIKDEAYIRKFIKDLVEFLDMKAYGEPLVAQFGEGELFGYSFVQLIYTSSIVGHVADVSGDIYLDVFSCKEFVPHATEEFCKEYFKASKSKSNLIFR